MKHILHSRLLIIYIAQPFILTLLISFCVFALPNDSFASSLVHAIELANNPKESLKVKISSLSPTRIGFGGYSIAEVIGDEKKYKIIADSAGQNVFITPKAEVGTIIPITIITSNNFVQDLLLEVMSNEPMPQSILITIHSNMQDKKAKLHNSTIDKEAASLMLKAMINDSNRDGKYYVTTSSRKLSSPSLASLKILQDKTYHFGDLIGVSLVITNKGKEPVHITEEMLSKMFKGTSLVTISDNFLSKGASTKAFVITKKGDLQ